MASTALLVETPAYLEAPASAPVAEDTVRDLIHELRQPLSSMDAIAYYLEMTMPAEQMEARQYMRRLQQLVDQTSSILERAAADYREPQRARAGSAS